MIMSMSTADRRGATADEIDEALRYIKSAVDRNLDQLAAWDFFEPFIADVGEKYIEVVEMDVPNYEQIERQYEHDLRASCMEAILPYEY